MNEEKIIRFERLSDEVERLVTATRERMRGLARAKALCREERIEVGHSLIDLKLALKESLTKHGAWQAFYEKTFADGGISLRRAQVFMKLARQTGEKRTGSFLTGSDDQIDEAIEQYKKAVEAARRATPPVLKVPQHFSNQAETNDMQQFWKADDELLEKQTVALWRQLLRESRRTA